MGRLPAMWAYKRLRTKYFDGISSENQPPYLLQSPYGKVRILIKQRPEWMINQIRSNLKPFAKTGISKTALDRIMAINHPSLKRFKIRKKVVYLNGRLATDNDGVIARVLRKIVKMAPVPEVDFILTEHDSFYHASPLADCKGPLFSFAKRKEDHGIILMPDREVLEGYFGIMDEVQKGIAAFPWYKKEAKAFWRGANSGFLLNSLDFMNPQNFLEYPRVQLVLQSILHSDYLDAGFNFLPHTDQTTNEILISQGYVKPSVSIYDHLKYKSKSLSMGIHVLFRGHIGSFFLIV